MCSKGFQRPFISWSKIIKSQSTAIFHKIVFTETIESNICKTMYKHVDSGHLTYFFRKWCSCHCGSKRASTTGIHQLSYESLHWDKTKQVTEVTSLLQCKNNKTGHLMFIFLVWLLCLTFKLLQHVILPCCSNIINT